MPLTFVQSVSGMLTNLPCNITPSVPGDKDCFQWRCCRTESRPFLLAASHAGQWLIFTGQRDMGTWKIQFIELKCEMITDL